MPLKLRVALGAIVIALNVVLAVVWQRSPGSLGSASPFGPREVAEAPNGVFTLYGPGRVVLLVTSRAFSRGDLFITEDDICYEVVRVWGRQAHAREVPLPVTATAAPQAIPLGAARPVAVVYHTHSGESYIPTDGRAFTPGKGGILEVGHIFADNLEEKRFVAIHDRSRHEPHDALAYLRSARTVVRNLASQPLVLFDVHRDAAPATVYRTRIDGKVTARVLLVVGRQNPLRSANLKLARRLKAGADDLHPRLVKGIFLARGNYNQHLDPGCLLIEIGTATQPRAEAERAAALLAEVVSRALGPLR